MTRTTQIAQEATIAIGGTPILLRWQDEGFWSIVEQRYSGFVREGSEPECKFDVEVVRPERSLSSVDELLVEKNGESWRLERGDFRVDWNARTGEGHMLQTATPYAIDTALRIVHTILQASWGGFLLHGASAIRHGRAFLFSGVSGAGKTTISRLAPSDAILLTDEISYGEMTTAEIKGVLDQLAEAGVFFLVFSGGEVFMRRDFLDLVEHARKLQFNAKVKTNGVMIHEAEARRLRELGVEQMQLSVYSHRPEVHDAITKLPRSLKRTIDSIKFLKSQGLKVTLSNVLMTVNRSDHKRTQALTQQLGIAYTLDPTLTPMIDGSTSNLYLRVDDDNLDQLFSDPELVGNVEEYCKPPAPVDEDAMEGYSCSAGHTACYISPYGDVFPCVAVPVADRQCASPEVCRHLVPLSADAGGALHQDQRLDGMFFLFARGDVLPVSGAGVYGRQHARSVDHRLREVVPSHRDPVGQHDPEGRFGVGWPAGANSADDSVRAHVSAKGARTWHHRFGKPAHLGTFPLLL
jgi:organic radical activating enzyme